MWAEGEERHLGRPLVVRLRTVFNLFIYVIRCFLCDRISSKTGFFQWFGAGEAHEVSGYTHQFLIEENRKC